MSSEIHISNNNGVWEIVPTNAIAGILLVVLFFYLFFRHFLFCLMLCDLIIGWLRKFNWFPKEGKRKKALIHWLIAVGLFVVFLIVASSMGWLKLIPK